METRINPTGIIFTAAFGAFHRGLWVALAELFVGIALLAWFLVRQTHLEEPLIDLRPFATPAFMVGISIVTLTLMTVFAMNMIMPTFLQESLGFTAFSAAVTLFLAVVCSCITSPFAGRIYDRHGVKLLLPVGMTLMIAAEATLWGCGMLQGIAIAGALVALLYAPVAVGSGLVFGPAQTFALSKLPELGPIFCHCDDINYGHIPGLEFRREHTLCTDGEPCDFLFVKE